MYCRWHQSTTELAHYSIIITIMHDCTRHCLRHLLDSRNQYKSMPFLFHVITCSFALGTEFQLGPKREISRRECQVESEQMEPSDDDHGARAPSNSRDTPNPNVFAGSKGGVSVESCTGTSLPSVPSVAVPRMEYRIKKGKTKGSPLFMLTVASAHGEIVSITNLSNPVVSEAIGNRIMRCSLRRPFI